MLSSNNRYQRIGNDESAHGGAMEMAEVIPSAPAEVINPVQVSQQLPQESTGSEGFSVKVLLKEKVFDVGGLSAATKVGDFKIAVEGATTVPAAQQRLICAGKQLKPDTKTLGDFKVQSGSSIHLFPLPVATPSVPTASAVDSSGQPTYNAVTVQGVPAATTATGTDISHRPIHFDPQVNQTSREVKLWCMILMFLSAMTLFNNLSYVSATGKLGHGVLDSIVIVLDTLVSALGLVVGNMGMQSVRTMDLEDVNKYVNSLVALASLAVCLRVLWVVDVVMQVQGLVRRQREEDADEGKNNDPSTVVDDAVEPIKLDGRTVISYGIQATIIALFIIFAWGSCVMRARRLQTAVAQYNNAMQV